MNAFNMRAAFALLASLAIAGCAGGSRVELEPENQSVAAAPIAAAAVEAHAIETKDLPPPDPGDLLAKARAIAASKGLGGGEDEARARAALAPLIGGGGNQTGDAQSTFQRAAMRFDAQGRGERQERGDQLEASDPREIFRKAQALALSRARDAATQDARAFGALAPAQNPFIAKPETYFVEALRMRQQQSALALGRSVQ
jgi:hypothetical protein